MKKIKIISILLISMFAFNINVLAASGSLFVDKSSVYVGGKFTVSVKVNSAAAWNIHVTSSGPVKDCSINQADATSDAMDTNKTFKATCTATAEGTITISLSGDVTSASDGNAVSVSGTKTVKVTTKPATDTPTQSGNQNNNLSKNNNLKSLTVEGYQLTKVNKTNYTLTVSNDVTSININATAEDTKAKVSGTGTKELKVGENNIEVTITSESGSKNKINIKVTRKDGYYLDDLETLLKDNKLKELDIITNNDSKITTEQINKIKDSKKIVRFNNYDENKKISYSWSIDGSKITDSKEFITSITYTEDIKKEISELSNYADGLYVNFNHDGELSSGTKIKLYVGDKFENENKVNVYYYDKTNKELNINKEKVNVLDGYVEFEIEKGSEYFITMSNIGLSNKESSSTNLFTILAIVEFITIIGLITIYFIKLKPKKNI